MKILLLCNKSPFPPREGGPIAMHAIVSGLLDAGHQVKILAVNTNKYFTRPEDIPEEYRQKTGIEFVYIDLSIKPADALVNLLAGQSYHVARFYTKEFEHKLASILHKEEFDIIQLETLFMGPYLPLIRKYSDAQVILRAHNIECLIWERTARSCRNPLKRSYLKHLALTLRQYELQLIGEVDGIAAITSIDAEYFRNKEHETPVISIPFGIDTSASPVPDYAKEQFPSLFHIGSMNWIPNQESIRWFIEKVWPELHQRHEDLKLYLAGRGMPDWLLNLNQPGIIIVGEVDDARAFMRDKSVMIVPLLSGSGIRIKIIEGMMEGKAIVTTSVGAEGIEAENGRHLLLADTPEEFIAAIERCISDRTFCHNLGMQAREMLLITYDNRAIIKKLTGFYTELIAADVTKESI